MTITDARGTTISRASFVDITWTSDFKLDGGMDGEDAVDFLLAWTNGASRAEPSLDVGTNGRDAAAFLVRWENGC